MVRRVFIYTDLPPYNQPRPLTDYHLSTTRCSHGAAPFTRSCRRSAGKSVCGDGKGAPTFSPAVPEAFVTSAGGELSMVTAREDVGTLDVDNDLLSVHAEIEEVTTKLPWGAENAADRIAI